MPKKKGTARNTATLKSLNQKKHTAIQGKLGGGLQTKLDTRLQSVDEPTAKQMESLLHFDRQSRGSTTEEQRLSVRAALTGYVARGGDIQAANRLKGAIATMTPAQLAKPAFTTMLQALQSDADLPLAALSEGLLDPTSPTARRDFEQLKQLLTAFPPDISRANAIELVDNNVTIGRDATGQLEIKNYGLAFATVAIPKANEGLDKTAIDALKEDFRTLARESYSTQGLALDFMQFFQTTNAQRQQKREKLLTMDEAFQAFKPDGIAASDKYKSGDCMCHAQKLKDIIEKKSLKVHVIGMNNQSLTKMADPKGGKEKVEIAGVDQVTEGVTHTDLMVPYTDDRGNPKILILAPGAGAGDNYIREFNLDAEGGILIGNRNDTSPGSDQTFAKQRRVGSGPDPGMDADALQKAQFKFRHNLQLLNSLPGVPEANKSLVGIDLVAGTIYLNGNTSKQYLKAAHMLPDGKDPANLGSLSFDFKAAIANPDKVVTIQVWDATTGTYSPRQVTQLQSLQVFLRLVQKQFGQPDDWFRNTLALMIHHEQYNAEILLPNLNTAAQMQTLGKAAVKAEPFPSTVEDAAYKKQKAAYEKLMKEAGEAVQRADGNTAKARYSEAIVVSDLVAADTVIERLKASKPEAVETAEKIRKLAQQAIDAGNLVKASDILQKLTRQGLVRLGIPVQDAAPATVKALADFPLDSNKIKVIVDLDRLGRDQHNSLSNEVASRIANIGKHSPQLATRLTQLAERESKGQEKAGITDFMTKRAQYDHYMADLKSPLNARNLPTAATLGFDPKFHITLAPDQYTKAKTAALRLQQEDGVLTQLSFNDGSHTIHMGYTYQAYADIMTALDANNNLRADGITTPATDGLALKNAIRSAYKIDNLSRQAGLELEKAFGNPALQIARQNTRFDAVYAMYDQYNDFDFAAYDNVYGLAVQTILTNNLQGKSATDQMTELLKHYQGFTIGDTHTEAEMKQVLLDNLDHLAAQNVKLLGIEHLKDTEFSDLLHKYYNQPPGAPMSPDLAAMLTTAEKGVTNSDKLYGPGVKPKFFTQIVEKAKQLGIQIVPLDTENNRAPEDAVHGLEVRMGAMNMVGEKLLRPQLTTLKPGEKFVLLAGRAHNNTHPGLTRGMPGFAQTLGIPAVQVIIDKDKDNKPIPIQNVAGKVIAGKVLLHLELDLEDPTRRRPATAEAPN
ncbi:MAG TPA: hypothetical protein V6C88_03375 [Chroococcidiopsis sp.]